MMLQENQDGELQGEKGHEEDLQGESLHDKQVQGVCLQGEQVQGVCWQGEHGQDEHWQVQDVCLQDEHLQGEHWQASLVLLMQCYITSSPFRSILSSRPKTSIVALVAVCLYDFALDAARRHHRPSSSLICGVTPVALLLLRFV
ncbi:hypothetical protein U1Q18_029890 [Sarracenia purpurea var. burkii]